MKFFKELLALWDLSGAPTEVTRTFAIIGAIVLFLLVIVIFGAVEKARFRGWYGRNGDMDKPMRPWRTIIPWHRMGSKWCDKIIRGGDKSDENAARERKYLYRETDSAAFTAMMRAYVEKPLSETYRAAVSRECRRLLKRIVRPGLAIQYVVALGKRDLLWELLIDQIESNVLVKEA